MTFLGEAETAIRLDIKAWFADVGLSTSDSTLGQLSLFFLMLLSIVEYMKDDYKTWVTSKNLLSVNDSIATVRWKLPGEDTQSTVLDS